MHLTRVFSYDRALSGLVQASPAYLYDFLHKSNENTQSHGNYLLPILLFARYFTHFGQAKTELVTSSSHDFHKTLQTTVRALSRVKTGVGAGQMVFLRPKIRSLFVERNAFFSELDFHAILPCVIFVVFYVILNSPGLRRQGSSGESEARQHNENPRPMPLPGKQCLVTPRPQNHQSPFNRLTCSRKL